MTQNELAELLGTTEEHGTSHEQMLEGATKLGLNAKIYLGLSLNKLQEMVDDGYVVIVNWMSGRKYDEDGHYSILEDVDEDIVTINDPEFLGSIRKFRRIDFEKMWFDFETKGRVDRMALVVI